MPNQDYILVAKFKRTHGIRGHIKLHSYTDPITNLLNYPLYIKKNENAEFTQLKIASCRQNNDEIIIKINNLDNPEDAAKLTNQLIYTTRDAIPDADTDEEYWIDIVGCNVYFNEQEFGTVTEVMETGANEVLVIKHGDNEYLMPYINDAIGKVDVKAKKIELLWHPDDAL
jgi:16S rRNA processing protein RimM